MQIEYRTETVKLPVIGIDAVIREPDGNAEVATYSGNKSSGRALMDFWAKCTVRLGDVANPPVEELMKLREPDYITLGLHIYCLATGKTSLKLAGACARCGKPNGATVDLTPWLDPEIPKFIVGPDPTWEMTTPRLGKLVVFGYPTAEQEFAALEKEHLDLNQLDLIAIRSVDGNEKVKLREVAEWPLADHIALREEMKAKKEWFETRIGLKHTCGFWEEVNFMQDPRFVRPGLIV